MEKETHKGHRGRLKNKLVKNGINSLEEHEILELLLYYAVPRRDTNVLSHKLLNKFGSISAVLDAPVEVIKNQGITENVAIYLNLIPQICRVYMDEKKKNEKKGVIIDDERIAETVKYKFIGLTNEAVVLLLMDSANKEIFCEVISEGSVNSCNLYVRKLIEIAVSRNAMYAVLAHNHPSGSLVPSKDDIITTSKVSKSLKMVGVYLKDHIIVSDEDYISLRQAGFME